MIQENYEILPLVTKLGLGYQRKPLRMAGFPSPLPRRAPEGLNGIAR
jgi:hypothetical protein